MRIPIQAIFWGSHGDSFHPTCNKIVRCLFNIFSKNCVSDLNSRSHGTKCSTVSEHGQLQAKARNLQGFYCLMQVSCVKTPIKVLNLSQNVLLCSTITVHFLFFFPPLDRPKIGRPVRYYPGVYIQGSMAKSMLQDIDESDDRTEEEGPANISKKWNSHQTQILLAFWGANGDLFTLEYKSATCFPCSLAVDSLIAWWAQALFHLTRPNFVTPTGSTHVERTNGIVGMTG